ncbi:MAG: hypothetical protein AAGD01_02005 [Acidobacteriota bacterium]
MIPATTPATTLPGATASTRCIFRIIVARGAILCFFSSLTFLAILPPSLRSASPATGLAILVILFLGSCRHADLGGFFLHMTGTFSSLFYSRTARGLSLLLDCLFTNGRGGLFFLASRDGLTDDRRQALGPIIKELIPRLVQPGLLLIHLDNDPLPDLEKTALLLHRLEVDLSGV